MQYLIGSLLVLFLLALLVGGVTGRVKTTSCCATDPRRDLRMRDAFAVDDPPAEDAVQATSDSSKTAR